MERSLFSIALPPFWPQYTTTWALDEGPRILAENAVSMRLKMMKLQKRFIAKAPLMNSRRNEMAEVSDEMEHSIVVKHKESKKGFYPPIKKHECLNIGLQ